MIVTTTTLVVVVGGLLMRLVDPHEFPTLEASLWWSLQTATTVGYGDVTPTTRGGHLVAALVMLNGVALIVVVTSTITSTFVARAQRERPGLRRDHDDLVERLDRLERLLREVSGPPSEPFTPNERCSEEPERVP